ncbi:MAG TPA: tetratricopeptide repeat protein [Chthoniobacter sp.]|jgi:predicted O-linked N-acetylglucosamine transferase (SPINDLY family)
MPPLNIQQAFDLAVQYHQAGRLAEAEGIYRQILGVEPNHADALHHLGIIAQQVGRYEASGEFIQRSLALKEDNFVAYSNLGVACFAMGQIDKAIAAYRQAIELQPLFAQAHSNLGDALQTIGEYEEAIAACRRALELRPDYAEAHNNLGNALKGSGRGDEAVAAYDRALELRPDYPEAHNNLGNALWEQGALARAISSCRRAIELRSGYPEAQNNLGNALSSAGQPDQAIEAYCRAIQLKADFAEAYGNLANLLRQQGRLDEALAMHRRAIGLKPRDAGLRSNLILTLLFRETQLGAIREEQRCWNEQCGGAEKRRAAPYRNERDPARRLRIGYVLPEFGEHVVARNVLPLFRHHDREGFEIICYPTTRKADALTEEFHRHVDDWRYTAGVSDGALSEMIQRDGIDILVDLALHTAGNRLPIFARRPAPVQVSFAGYPESSGLEAIEYRISDRWLEADASEMGDGRWEIGGKSEPDLRSPNSDLRLAERVFHIDSFWCYDPCGTVVAVNELPAQEGGSVTFGSLNNFCKINDALLKLWARVMREVAGSRLVLLSGLGSQRQRTLDFLAKEGVAAERVEFVTPCPWKEYLERYHRIDIGLDPFPYGGHTTSLDALRMGVPVVSLAGERAVSRAGLSILNNLELPELVTFSKDEYVKIAVSLANDLPRLAELRRTLRARMEKSVLMDEARFTRQIEGAYRAMWGEWCAQR